MRDEALSGVKTSSMTVVRILKPADILVIVTVGLIRLIGAPQHYRAAPCVGVGFVVNFTGALVAAVGLTGMCYGGGCWVLWSPVGCL